MRDRKVVLEAAEARSSGNGRLDRTTIFLPQSLGRRVAAFCLQEDKPKGAVIREAMTEYLDKRKFAKNGVVEINLNS